MKVYLESEKWIEHKAVIDFRTCIMCVNKDGTIYPLDDWYLIDPKQHPNCRCTLQKMRALEAGTATEKGREGADYYLKWYSELPDYYVTVDEATKQGWKSKKGNLADVMSGKMITGGIYKNKDDKLPHITGRIWYEADIDYTAGYRNNSRIVFSSDGLIFASYDHYATFVEIV